VSTDNPVIMSIFLIYSIPGFMMGVSNSNVPMKSAQIHYILSQNIGGDKRYYVPPLQKLCGTCPPLKLGPWPHVQDKRIKW